MFLSRQNPTFIHRKPINIFMKQTKTGIGFAYWPDPKIPNNASFFGGVWGWPLNKNSSKLRPYLLTGPSYIRGS